MGFVVRAVGLERSAAGLRELIAIRCRIETAVSSGERDALNRMREPVRFLLSTVCVSAIEAPGQPVWWPEADAVLFDAIEQHTEQTATRRVERLGAHINDAVIIDHVVGCVRELV